MKQIRKIRILDLGLNGQYGDKLKESVTVAASELTTSRLLRNVYYYC